jgi:CubicO group peptidase (beta-lactamase class C family)
MLLSHCSGFGPEICFFDPKNHLGKEFYSQDRERTKKILMKAPLEYDPGTSTVYSDTGFILLGLLIEKVTGINLAEAVKKLLYNPLGLLNTTFRPLHNGIDINRIAATSIGNTCNGTMDYPNIRRDVIRGEVQDEKAFYCLSGIAGHAGLFSTSSDLMKICETIQDVYHGSSNFFSRDTIVDFLTAKGPDNSFACGWRINKERKVSHLFGNKASELTIGHSGFTGTLSLIDLKNHLSIVLLTNKIHSSCYDRKRYAGSDFPTGKYAPVMDEIYNCLI